MATAVTLIAALLGAVATIVSAVITTRRTGPAGTTVPVATTPGGTVVAASARTSKAFWLGLAGLILWVIPLIGYCVIIPGLWIGIREMNGPRRRTGAGVAMCVIALALALVNSAIGAYQGAHGQMWFQQ